MRLRRGLALLMIAGVICLFSVYVSSVRANGQQAPVCDGGDGSNGTNWKWGFCHQGHPICTGDATEWRNHTGHTLHGLNNDNNPPRVASSWDAAPVTTARSSATKRVAGNSVVGHLFET